MSKRVAALIALFIASGCGPQHVAAPVCHAAGLADGGGAADGDARKAARQCVKAAAFALTAAGGAVGQVPARALSRCRAQEAMLLKSVEEGGRAWKDFQRRQVRADLTHLAALTAIQARSIGCGRPAGEGPETLLTSDNPS